ncbi:MAG: chemotaxis protein CheD [Proteobacteria bacterium]|nr:chemotaxis protein CheD [Pseudomonadota bacterium]MBU1611793.1 chemotaxis protein CheD [Pseudomonadota bacterium]
MSQIVVNISDMKFSKRTEDVLVTFSLGSCLGVTAYDQVAGVGGLLHALLPTASVSPEKAKTNPYMFVTTGVANMVKTLFRLGAKRENLVFKVAGGADMRGDTLFQTGSRNIEALLNLLEKNRIFVAGQDVGGSIPRTMFLHMDTGRVVVRTFGKDKEL